MKKGAISLALIILGLLLPLTSGALGSEYKKIFEEAETHFSNENYPAALALYLRLDSMERGNANTQFKIGLCYLQSPTYKTRAIPYLETAVKNITNNYEMGVMSEKKAPMSSYHYLAKAYHLNYEFDKAIEMYQKYRDEFKADPKYKAEIDEANRDIETCNNGKELVKKPRQMIVTNLGAGVNSPYADYSPVVSLDEQTILFTSRREGGASKLKELNGKYFEDIYSSTLENEKWSKAKQVSINTTAHEATINLSADGQKLLIYKDKGGNGGIYESEVNGSSWNEPVLVAAPINSSAWESHACYTADNRILYFVSDRPGGFGGRDIYKCNRLPNGDWGPAQNLGENINTAYDEDGVFIHPDGKLIFFSSKGHNSMGGFDIFTSFIDDENGFWTKPENYGYPVNTTDDDVFLITTADGKRAFFSSDKEGGYGEKDIYMITFPENEPRDITVLVGKVLNPGKADISDNKIILVKQGTTDTLQVLNANSATGKFGTNLPVGTNYEMVCMVGSVVYHTEVLEVPKNKGYQVIRKDLTYLAPGDTLNKAIAVGTNQVECDPQPFYQLNFGYNKHEINSSDADFERMMAALAECVKNSGGKVSVFMEASASRVPTRTYGSNEKLTRLRVKSAQERILQSLQTKGINPDKIVFSAPEMKVQGPQYNNDAKENAAEYQKYQYIHIRAGRSK
jgi:tetratricopeptide (TPR) repeat protein